MPLQHRDAAALGFPPGATYGSAFRSVNDGEDRGRARDFTRAVLALRSDERVQGKELSAPA